MTTTLRALTEQDAEAAFKLYQELGGAERVIAEPQAPARFAEIVAHPGTEVLGAEVEGEIHAMLTLHILPNMTWWGRPYALIENVVTAKAARGQGLGRALMEEAIARAWAADAYKIMLMTGRAAEARGFYEKLGFSAEEKWGMTLRRTPTRQT